MTFAVNVAAPFILLLKLLPLVQRAGRVGEGCGQERGGGEGSDKGDDLGGGSSGERGGGGRQRRQVVTGRILNVSSISHEDIGSLDDEDLQLSKPGAWSRCNRVLTTSTTMNTKNQPSL